MHTFTKVLLITFLLCFPFISSADEIYSKNHKANELYKQGKYEEALKLYEDALLLSPSDEKLKMNQGSTLYRLGDYDKAEESYNGALSVKDKKAKSDAHYNMGNILYKKAEQIQHQDLQGAQQNFKSALQHFIQSLDLSPDNIDAKWNLQLTHQKIKQLEQQQQQQQNQQNKDNKDNKDDKDKQNENNQQQNNEQKEEQKKSQDNKEDQKDNNQNQQDQQQNQQQQQEQSEMKESEEHKDMKKEDARRLIELYADDADSLNKPMKKKARPRQPEQDW